MVWGMVGTFGDFALVSNTAVRSFVGKGKFVFIVKGSGWLAKLLVAIWEK